MPAEPPPEHRLQHDEAQLVEQADLHAPEQRLMQSTVSSVTDTSLPPLTEESPYFQL